MKTLTTFVIFCCFITLNVFAQRSNLELSVKEKSNDPNSKTERYHLLELRNNSNSSLTIELISNNANCSDVESTIQTDLNQDFLDRNKRNRIKSLTLSANQTTEFYIKIFRPTNTKLNHWNCTEIIAKDVSGNMNSNTLTIKTFIPDPKDFN